MQITNNFCPAEIDSELFDYERFIDNGNEFLARRFKATHEAEGLTKYFQKQAKTDELENFARNYVVKFKGTELIVAFFTLKAGAIPFSKDSERLVISKDTKLIPGVELVNIATNDIVARKTSQLEIKIGEHIFHKIIEPVILKIAGEVGVKVLYLFVANQKLAEYYKTWGFYLVENSEYNNKLSNEWQNSYNNGCIFMYKPIAEISVSDS